MKKLWIMYLEQYIVELRQARQWKSDKPSVEAGDLVLLVEKDVAQCHWQLTVVKEVPSSVDELVYTVIVKIKAGKYKNPSPNLPP
jgi:hypothetical protein